MSSTDPSESDPDEAVRDWTAVQQSSERVRSYKADGRLYAYQENDEHVIVSRGRNPRDQWVKRVPAARNAEEVNEKLWTIPSNWERRIGISGVGNNHNTVYFDPLADAEVMVSVPRKSKLVDAWYGVEGIGQFQFKFDGKLDFGALEETIKKYEKSSEVSTKLIYSLRSLANRWDVFEREYSESIESIGGDVMWYRIDQENTTLDGWSINPWQDIVDAKEIVRGFLSEDRDTAEQVANTLIEEDVISPYPELKAVFSKDEDN